MLTSTKLGPLSNFVYLYTNIAKLNHVR